MKTSNRILCALSACVVFLSDAVHSAEIIVQNWDDPGVGFNDTTPAAPVGGNPGTTIGEQRWNVFNYAAELWGAELRSNEPIILAAFFGPLACSPDSGVLGSAAPASVFANFAGLPLADTWYVGPLADSLSQQDLDPGFVDMIARFNGDIGVNPNCLTGISWYNGLNNNHDRTSEVNLLTVVMHEFAHGFGFLDLAHESTGEFFFGLPDAYLVNMRDLDLDRNWHQMSDAERLASQTNTHRLVWSGEQVNRRAQFILGPRFSVIAQAPSPIEGNSYEAKQANFGLQIPEGSGVTGNIKNGRDGVGNDTDGCEPINNNVRHRIAILDRGGCSAIVKVLNAQAAQARAVIVVNNEPGLPSMGGTDPAITIAAVGVSQADGAELRQVAVFDPPTTVKLKFDNNELIGTSEGLVRLYAPIPVEPGSSKSHFDTTATPNLLMEPFITNSVDPIEFLDLTPRVLDDIGWRLQ